MSSVLLRRLLKGDQQDTQSVGASSAAASYAPAADYTLRSLTNIEFDEDAQQGLEELKVKRGHQEAQLEEQTHEEESAANHQHKEQQFLLKLATEKRRLADDKAFYVPAHATQIAVHSNFVETTGTLGEHLMDDWFPESEEAALLCFGSKDKWAQGLMVPVHDEPTGNLRNVFICGITCTNLRNDADVPIGVEVGQTTEDGLFRPFGDALITHRQGTRYHAILPPRGTTHAQEEITLYRNTARINHYLGRKYPHLHEANAHVGIQKNVQGTWLCTLFHPLIDVIYLLRHEFGWPEPDEIQQRNPETGEYETYMVITGDTKRRALEVLRQILRNDLPVVDLTRFRLRFTALCSDKASHLRARQQLQERQREAEQAQAHKKQLTGGGGWADEVHVDTAFGVSFTKKMVYMFRDHVKTLAWDDGEEGEEEEGGNENGFGGAGLRVLQA